MDDETQAIAEPLGPEDQEPFGGIDGAATPKGAEEPDQRMEPCGEQARRMIDEERRAAWTRDEISGPPSA